ncbi:response regulator [Ramlibacter terrae]|uniref:Response regulator n=1 Tax=Ramlibacter terrae TaxID=2732511 RepID=A0ABX6P3R8_9BURK|nr:response regulator [Ramlibacter terrae]
MVQTVARELQAHAASKKLRLVLDLPPQPVHAHAEELLCYSTIANLLKNALEASPENADVRVTLRGGDDVMLAIRNLGEVPAPVRDSFFAKYATHGKPAGHGLGAYSAQLMARVQRGQLTMASGAGETVLTLRLPLSGEAPATSPAGIPVTADAAPEAAPLPPLSVLLVDDDEYNIVVLKSLLPSPPLSVRTAVNGRAALECVREARPDVIFLDVEMPVMGGIEALQAIRALQAERGEPPSL